jgi:hypothetical protein
MTEAWRVYDRLYDDDRVTLISELREVDKRFREKASSRPPVSPVIVLAVGDGDMRASKISAGLASCRSPDIFQAASMFDFLDCQIMPTITTDLRCGAGTTKDESSALAFLCFWLQYGKSKVCSWRLLLVEGVSLTAFIYSGVHVPTKGP